MKKLPPMYLDGSGFFNFMQVAIALYESEEEWQNIPIQVQFYADDDNEYRVSVTDLYWDQDTHSVIIKIDGS